MKNTFLLIAMVIFISLTSLGTTITSLGTGNWSGPGTWDSGTIPTATDDVVIASGHTVTIDLPNAECNNLTIVKYLYFDILTSGNKLTVHGNVTLGASSRLRAASGTPVGIMTQELVLEGNLTNDATSSFDMRIGSGSNVSVVRVVFSGSSNSTISLGQTTYGTSVEEFNSIEINKSGGAKVILAAGNLFQSNNSSTAPDTLILNSGIIETQGTSVWAMLRTSSGALMNYSSASYINGTLGVGITNSGSLATRDFPVGDATNYRPLTIKVNGPVNTTGHNVWARLVSGNANTGGSTFSGGIDKVSQSKYYEVGYTGSAASMGFYEFEPSYSTDDGVSGGNTDLRVAYSTDNRATWDNSGPTSHNTAPPSTIAGDSISPTISINSGSSMFVALANATGGVNALPVELQSFTAESNRGSVELAWSTATEVNNAGFEIERTAVSGQSSEKCWSKVGFVEGSGTSNSPKNYSFIEKNVDAGSYSYRLKQIDRDGKFEYSKSIEVSVIGAPTMLALQGNYPNPFNPTTNISFTVPAEGRATVKVFNLLGKEVATVFDGSVVSGKQYAVPFNASSLPSGIYFSQLEFGGQKLVNKMMLMK